MANTTDILAKYNTEEILGKKFTGEDARNPSRINLNSSGEYTINQLAYPEDVSVSGSLQHYIVFYINARGKTKFKTADQRQVDVDVSSKGQNRTSQTTQGRAGLVGTAVVAGTATTAGLNNLVGSDPSTPLGKSFKSGVVNLLKKSGIGAVDKATAAVGALAGVSAAFALDQLNDTLVIMEPARLTDAIMLPIDSIPSVKYSMQYDQFDLGVLGGLLGGSSAVDSSAMGRIGETTLRALTSLGDAAKVAGISDPKQAIFLAGKVQTNPFREVFFKSIDYRTFTFGYTFLPKSETEVYNVKRIIDLFKFHMHPELSKHSGFYIYPSEFEMQYYYKGVENKFIHKISTCVLENMSVNYGGEYFTSFTNGAPAEIKMSLTFKEVELLTKERIVKGF